MKKAYLKDIGREIKRTKNRYISIIAIVILGVAFFVGINTASPDMLDTFNKYINDCNMFDLNLVSTVGFDDADLNTIKNTDKIYYIEPTKSVCVVTKKGDKEKVINIISAPKEVTDKTINKIELVEGNYPTNNNEIILDNKLSGEYKVGDIIDLIDVESQNLEDIFKVTSYTVVGFANSPLYVATSRGNTSLVDGTISGFAIVLEDAFSMEEYTNVYARVTTVNTNRTSDEYIEEIEEIQKEIEQKTNKLADDKYVGLYNEAKTEIEDGKNKIQDAKDELNSAEVKIANARQELVDGEKELASQKNSYNKKIKEYENKIKEAETTLDDTKKTLDEKQKEIDSGLKKLNSEEQKLLVAETNILKGTGINDLETYLEYLSSISAPQEVIDNIKNIISGKKEIEVQKQILEGYQTELKEGLNKYNQGLKELNTQKQELANSKKTAQSEFKAAENKISNGWSELKENENKFEKEKVDALKEIEDAEKDIKDAEKQLEDLKVKIYVLNLETNEGYVSYKSDCGSVETIGKVFPIIFFLVAALVSLTAMTRMVEENRNIIGTYKSLGYSKAQIASKYLIYSTTATLIGIILGIVIGSYTLPWVIAEGYGILYHTIPTVIMSINMNYSLIAGIAAFTSTTIATVFACYKVLRATPAKLMRPKAPKEGKKILLEKIPFIWKHFTFIQKITARNVFRYKKRLTMTVVGIAGCTALIFTGFGLRGSIASIVDKQYGNIRKYDFEITLKNNLSDEQNLELNKYIEENVHEAKYIYLRQQTNDVSANGEEQNAYIVGFDNQEELKKFVTMRNRETKEELSINDNEIIITEKLSKLLNVDIGDEITIQIDDENMKVVKISGITENYVYHYIYMSKALYEKIFEEEMVNNQIYLKIDDILDEQAEDEISRYLLANDNISKVLKISDISKNFSDMIGSLDIIVIVLIVGAGLLAFVVLYNLNSINIEERKRELATIKLLGFNNKELSSYVFRENIILTIIGAAVGLILGVYLHFFIVSTAEMDMVMFSREKTITSYVFSFLMTIVFAIIINLIMNKDLRKIDMIESLKSVE